MKPSEIASEQIFFENSRRAKNGETLADVNSVEYLLTRLRDEVEELAEAVACGHSVENQLLELCDVFIFSGAIGAKLCIGAGEPLKLLDGLVAFKMRHNAEKYSEGNFAISDTPEDAIIYSREKWEQSDP